MNIVAVCHDCQKRHTYQGAGHVLYERLGEWRDKHPPGRCTVDFIPELGGHEITARVAGYGHNADVKLALASSAAFTITLAGLGSSATFTAGRESTAVSNTTNLYLDYLIGAKVTTGTSPTTGKQIRIYGYGSVEDTPTYVDVLDGTDSAETFTSADILAASCPLIGSTATDGTSNQTYWFAPVSLAGFFGGIVPKNFGVFVSHSTGVALNATGSNHAVWYTGLYETVA